MKSIFDKSKALVLILFIAFVGACAEEVKTEEVMAEEVMAEEVMTEEVMTEEVMTEEVMTEARMGPSHRIYVQVKSDSAGAGAGAEVRVNDIPVREGIFAGSLSQILVNFYLLSGENTLSIKPYSTVGSVTVEMIRYPVFPSGRLDTSGEEMLLSIKSEGGGVSEIINLPSERPTWAWLDADFVDNDVSRAEAIAFSKMYYSAYAEADVNIVVPANRPIYEDLARLSPTFDFDSMSERLGVKLKSYPGKDIWVFDELDGIEFDVVPVANGKLFSVRRKDGTAFFRTVESDTFGRIVGYTMIGKKDGEWAFYR